MASTSLQTSGINVVLALLRPIAELDRRIARMEYESHPDGLHVRLYDAHGRGLPDPHLPRRPSLLPGVP